MASSRRRPVLAILRRWRFTSWCARLTGGAERTRGRVEAPLAQRHIGVAEHPHPRTAAASPLGRHPGPLAQLEASLGVGHDRQVAAVRRAERGDAQGAAVRVVRIGRWSGFRRGPRSGRVPAGSRRSSPGSPGRERAAGPRREPPRCPVSSPPCPCSMTAGLLSMRTVLKRDSKRSDVFLMNRGLR